MQCKFNNNKKIIKNPWSESASKLKRLPLVGKLLLKLMNVALLKMIEWMVHNKVPINMSLL
jgi:hypothetical protein